MKHCFLFFLPLFLLSCSQHFGVYQDVFHSAPTGIEKESYRPVYLKEAKLILEDYFSKLPNIEGSLNLSEGSAFWNSNLGGYCNPFTGNVMIFEFSSFHDIHQARVLCHEYWHWDWFQNLNEEEIERFKKLFYALPVSIRNKVEKRVEDNYSWKISSSIMFWTEAYAKIGDEIFFAWAGYDDELLKKWSQKDCKDLLDFYKSRMNPDFFHKEKLQKLPMIKLQAYCGSKKLLQLEVMAPIAWSLVSKGGVLSVDSRFHNSKLCFWGKDQELLLVEGMESSSYDLSQIEWKIELPLSQPFIPERAICAFNGKTACSNISLDLSIEDLKDIAKNGVEIIK